ncbi:hypothetical protein COV19_07070 [Candidatus Woesearchaeota archaeon CG10_big_fil_rev_8_21_14_0_10_44_13]|nr:MAG: hypothetical protein COV19_07070 [Candidatus Woesearchaeota archaeon CG10_big_fil_rev_8_21_14_0_10_44_13]
MIFSLQEIFDIAVMSGAIGYMFNDSFGSIAHRTEDYDPLTHYRKRFDFDSLMFAVIVAAPAIILHELGHKFVAMSFGFTAVFHAAYTWLFIGVILKLLNFGFIFFVPAYVSYSGLTSPLQSSMIAFAGPFVNLLLWIVPFIILKKDIKMKRKVRAFLFLTSRINMFLFIFNMLPIPMFDGYHVFQGLISAFM